MRIIFVQKNTHRTNLIGFNDGKINHPFGFNKLVMH